MAPLAHTLALLAMVMATMAIKMTSWRQPRSTICGRSMTELSLALNRSEFQQNPLFARVWTKAAAEWQRQGRPESPLSPAQAIAVIAYTTKNIYKEFNDAVRIAGRSPQQYRDNFHFKTLHVLLTQAITTLRDAQKGKCVDLLQKVCGVQFEAKHGDTIQFSELASILLNETTGNCSGKETFFRVYTCQGVDISFLSHNSQNWGVLIPPFETFKVTQVTKTGDKAVIQLRSTGTSSIDDCEDAPGGSVSSAPCHLGGLLMITTALAVATRIL